MLVTNRPDARSFSELGSPAMAELEESPTQPDDRRTTRRRRWRRWCSGVGRVCQAPLRVCQLPGALELPPNPSGTLVLGDVDQLTIMQQVALFDWLGRHSGRVQVVSVARTPIPELLADGRFLRKDCSIRLNTVMTRSIDGHDAPGH